MVEMLLQKGIGTNAQDNDKKNSALHLGYC